jgi:histidine triad (HIT) family protein
MCAVCQKHRDKITLPGGVIFEDQNVFIAHFPLLPEGPLPYAGHIIIEMKRHITKPSELTPPEAQSLGLWIQRISEAQERVLEAEHTYIFRIGDKTPHLHFHLVPRYAGTPKEVWGVSLFEWQGALRSDSAAIKNISEKMRTFIKRL